MKGSVPMVRRLALGVFVVCILGTTVLAIHRHFYPHGFRAGMLPTFMAEMWSYAQEHGGWYPKDGATPLESLQELYPVYESEGLAGLSGSERRTLKVLKDKKPLDSNVSSWIYWPGYRVDDDPRLAIIWEREEGLFTTGGRASGHAVGFAVGGCTQIPSEKWADFLKEQELLRQKVLSARLGATNSHTEKRN